MLHNMLENFVTESDLMVPPVINELYGNVSHNHTNSNKYNGQVAMEGQ